MHDMILLSSRKDWLGRQNSFIAFILDVFLCFLERSSPSFHALADDLFARRKNDIRRVF